MNIYWYCTVGAGLVDDIAELNTIVTDETVSIDKTKISMITMIMLFIFHSMHFRTNRLRAFVSFYLLQTIFHI